MVAWKAMVGAVIAVTVFFLVFAIATGLIDTASIGLFGATNVDPTTLLD